MRERMDADAYRAMPKWMREGIAVWAADQGPGKLERALIDPAFTTAEAAFPGLEAGEHGVDRYAEYFLAFDLLERKKGAGSVAKLVRRLVDGEPPDEALGAIAGMTAATFKDEARSDAIAAATRADPDGTRAMRAIASLDKGRKYAQVRSVAAEFEEDHPRSPCLADVLYFRGKAERLDDDPGAAIATLERLIGRHLDRSHYFDEAWYQLGSAQLASKKPKEAAASFRAILRDFPDTSLHEKAALRLAQALAESGERDEAIRWLDRFDRSFPKSASAVEAKSLRAKLGSK
jgi:TolA-binding protein